jgi:hypothetical protein
MVQRDVEAISQEGYEDLGFDTVFELIWLLAGRGMDVDDPITFALGDPIVTW